MVNYDIFAKFYDDIIGQPSSNQHEMLEKLIKQHAPKAKTVLELGCGTGSVLEQLSKHYSVVGIDLSKEMVKRAKKKVPSGTFSVMDMSSFRLNQKFDVILCMFDSINHLTTFDQWKSLFQSASQHLTESGIFIFDYNTIEKLEKLAQSPAWTKSFGNNQLIMQVVESKKHVYTCFIKVFEHSQGTKYQLWEEAIQEASFPQTKILTAARKYFTIQKVFSITLKKILDKSEKIYVICKKA